MVKSRVVLKKSNLQFFYLRCDCDSEKKSKIKTLVGLAKLGPQKVQYTSVKEFRKSSKPPLSLLQTKTPKNSFCKSNHILVEH